MCALIKDEVEMVNARFARVENIRKFKLLDKALGHDDNELTATMKVRHTSTRSYPPRSRKSTGEGTRTAMPNLNPAWVQAVKDSINPCPLLRPATRSLSSGDQPRPQAPSTLRPGPWRGLRLAYRRDAAGFWTAYTETVVGLGLTTVEMKFNYLAAAVDGSLIGLGKCFKHGKTLALAEARVEDAAGRLLAHGTVNLIVMPKLQLPDQARLSAKLLEE